MTNKPNRIEEALEAFRKEFVKDLGEKVEPVFLDPNGAVGPVMYFLKSTLEQFEKEIRREVAESVPTEIECKCEIHGDCNCYDYLEQSIQQWKKELLESNKEG